MAAGDGRLLGLGEHDGQSGQEFGVGEALAGVADLVDQDDVGAVRVRRVAVHRDDGVTLRRARRDRRSLDAEEATFEVDVVQLLAVDEAARGLVADDRAVLPAVPEARDDVDDLGVLRFGVHLGRQGAPAEVRDLGFGARRHREDAGAAAAREVERSDGRRDVERLGVRGGDRRDEADSAGHRGYRGEGQQRVEPAPDDLFTAWLERESVVEGDEVERSRFGELRVR